jgi:hypothetical protein
MLTRRIILPGFLAVSAISTLSTPAHSQGQSDSRTSKGAVSGDDWGKPGDPNAATDFEIPSRTQKSEEGRSFKQNVRVRVLLTDVNPFLYNYRLEYRGQSVGEASPASFFNAVFGFEIPKVIETKVGVIGQLIEGTKPTPGDSALVASCSIPAQLAARQVDDLRVSLNDFFNDRISERATALDTELKTPVGMYRSSMTVMRSDTASSANIQRNAVTAGSALDSIAAAYRRAETDLKPLVDSHLAGVRLVQQSLQDQMQMHPRCLLFREIEIASRSLSTDTIVAKQKLATITARKGEAELSAETISRIANSRDRFFVTLRLPPLRGPTDIEIVVSRQPVTTNVTPVTTGTGDQAKPVKYDTVGRHYLNVGGRGRFTASAGIAWGDIPERTYTVAQRSVPNVDGSGTTTLSFVTKSKDSPSRVVPMLFLNTRICDAPRKIWRVLDKGGCAEGESKVPVNVVLGITPKALSLNRIDYFGGVGVPMLGERIFVNAGYYVSPVDVLDGTVGPGGQLPPGQAALSVHSKLAARLGLAITYRVAPW